MKLYIGTRRKKINYFLFTNIPNMTKSRWESSSEDEKEDNTSNHKNSTKKQKRSDEDNSYTIESCKCKSPIKDHSESSGLSNVKPPLITEYKPLFHGCRDVENYQRLNFIDQGTYGINKKIY